MKNVRNSLLFLMDYIAKNIEVIPNDYDSKNNLLFAEKTLQDHFITNYKSIAGNITTTNTSKGFFK